MWRGGNPFYQQEFNFLNFYLQRDGLVIFALPSEETLISRYRARNFSQQIKENELALARRLFLEKSQSVSNILYTSSSYEELDSLVADVLRRVNA
jgi:hypothetical protein